MALFRKLFYRKPPDGLLEICERVYVFDCCFSTDGWQEENYKGYIGGIVGQLKEEFPDASFLGFNFREGERQSQFADVLSGYDMTIMEYPRQYQGCPLLSMEVIHHFLRSGESWLSLGQQNLLLMHCEWGGWPVLAFMLAALLIYRKQYSGEQKTLDMIYKQAPRELLHLLSPLNPVPSQLRYLQYVSRRNVASDWPPLDRALTLDCVMLRLIPDFDGEGGCRPVFRIYGQDPFLVSDRTPKVLCSTPMKGKNLRAYKQTECELVKIDINCHIQGDVVLECVTVNNDMECEEMMFRVVFNTAFIRSNILILNRDEVDLLWDAKDQFPKDFKAEIIFSEMDASAAVASVDFSGLEEKEGLPVEAFAKVHEIFNSVDWSDPKADVALNVLQQISVSNILQEKSDSDLQQGVAISPRRQATSPTKDQESKMRAVPDNSSCIFSAQKTEAVRSSKSSVGKVKEAQQDFQISIQLAHQSDSMRRQAPQVLPEPDIKPVQDDHLSHECGEVTHTTVSKDASGQSSGGSSGSQSIEPKIISLSPSTPALDPHPQPTLASSGSKISPTPPPTPPPPPPRNFSASETVLSPLASETKAYSHSRDQVSVLSPQSSPITVSMSLPSLFPASSPPPTLQENANIKAAAPMPPPPPPPSTPPPPPPPPTPPLKENRNIRAGAPPPPPNHSGSAARPTSSSSVPPPPPPPPTSSSNSSVPTVPVPPVPSAPPPPILPGKGISRTSYVGENNNSGSPSPAPPFPAPPASSPSSKGLLSRTITSRSQQNKKLKPLHWLKLSRAVQGSLWAEAQKSGEGSKAPEIDMSELESLFSAAVPNSDKSGKSSTRGPKVDKVQLIEHRRAYNCEIMLSKVKVPLHELTSSVLALEDSTLDVDQVENLIKFCPTKEEMDLLKGYPGEKEKLGKCELFFLELMRVPRVESKLRVFSFKMQFHSQVSDLRNTLNIVNSVADEIRNSAKLKRIMQTILSLGNALNQGTARGSAIGFRLDSLLKLTETRARNNKMTLMHYLCKVLADKLPELLDFSKDLASLERASKVQLKFLAEEMQAVSKGLEKVVQELSASENDGPISESFCKTLKEFLHFAEAEVRCLASLYSGVGRNVDALILYFGEDPARCPFEQVISTLFNFVRLFNKAHEENCKQLDIQMKKLAESDKSKIDASQKEPDSLLVKSGPAK